MPSTRPKPLPDRDADDAFAGYANDDSADLDGASGKPAPTKALEAVYVDRSRPSKTALKNRMLDLQKLGEAVAGLPDNRLAALALPESLFDAIVQWRRTRSFEGRRRQMQYVGKLMRQVDEAPLQQAVAEYALGSARETLMLHRVEHWRDALVGGDDALTEWMRLHPDTDVQRLRQLVRRARTEQADPTQRQGRAFRELFQLLKPFLATEPADRADTAAAAGGA